MIWGPGRSLRFRVLARCRGCGDRPIVATFLLLPRDTSKEPCSLVHSFSCFQGRMGGEGEETLAIKKAAIAKCPRKVKTVETWDDSSVPMPHPLCRQQNFCSSNSWQDILLIIMHQTLRHMAKGYKRLWVGACIAPPWINSKLLSISP